MNGVNVNSSVRDRRNNVATITSAVLSLKEATEYLHLGEKEIRRLCATGELRAFRTRGGGAWRIPLASCDQFIDDQLSRAESRWSTD